MNAPKYRPLEFGVTRIKARMREDGVEYIEAEQPLQAYWKRMGDAFEHWVRMAPDRVMFAQRAKNADGTLGDWRKVTYAQAYAQARSIAQALIDRKLSDQRPVAILSENDIEHALLSLGCLLSGVPFCAVSPPYSLVSQDFEKLRHVLATLTPGLLFASDAGRYSKAIAATVSPTVELICVTGEAAGRTYTKFSALTQTCFTDAVERASQAIGPTTIAKFLFTSGSTKLPKAVINTHGMWCSNQQQMRQSMPAIAREPLVLVDWLPWNHTFGGNHNFGMIVTNGGTLYIDDGKPTPALMGETLRNLREIAPTVYFNVPTGFEAIANAMKTDAVLRKTLLSKVQMMFYAGAAMAQPIWDRLFEVQEQEIGERIVMTTGLGMTESGPFEVFVTSEKVRAGDLGVPTPGAELKLVPINGKIEVRYRGPNITPGYWRNDQATRESFDDEGFFKTGDAVQWIDLNDKHRGLRFDGRIAEDFKLATGTFVSVGPLRAKIIATGAPYVQDAVITGLNRREVGALIIPTQAVRALAKADATVAMAEVLAHATVQAHFQTVINTLAQTATGSATRVTRLHVLAVPPSIDKGEVTDKGSINQGAVLKERDALVEAMYADTLTPMVKLA